MGRVEQKSAPKSHFDCISNCDDGAISTEGCVEVAKQPHDGAEDNLVNKLVKEAESGDVLAMHKLGSLYSKGLYNEKKDQMKSFHWFKKAADKGHVPSLAIAGTRLLNGLGVAESASDAMILLGRAAQEGSDLGAFMLGDFYKHGRSGVQRDNAQAFYWLGKIVHNKCVVKHAHPSIYSIASTWLDDIDSEKPADAPNSI